MKADYIDNDRRAMFGNDEDLEDEAAYDHTLSSATCILPKPVPSSPTLSKGLWVHLDFESKQTKKWLDKRFNGRRLVFHLTSPETSSQPRFQTAIGGQPTV